METCACCGFATISEKGNFEICPICFWEDDSVQEADPWLSGGANEPSLYQAQSYFMNFGAMEERFISKVRSAHSNEFRNPHWRPLKESDKCFVSTPAEIEAKRGSKQSISYNYWERNA